MLPMKRARLNRKGGITNGCRVCLWRSAMRNWTLDEQTLIVPVNIQAAKSDEVDVADASCRFHFG